MLKIYSRRAHLFAGTLLTAIFCLSCSVVAQEKSDKTEKKRNFCASNNYSYNNKVSYKESRELTMNAVSLLTVDGQQNGGIHVRGENRSDILIRACVQTTGDTEQEAEKLAKNIRIETGSTIRAENAPDEPVWGVSYEISVPRLTNLKLTAHNGGIVIDSVEGTIDFETLNGGISVRDAAGNVRGRTTNGGVNVTLTGGGWKGAGLDVETKNGGVHLTIPENYAARIETGTINGGFRSDIAALDIDRTERNRAVRLNTDLNGGGAPVRVITTNGGVKINSN